MGGGLKNAESFIEYAKDLVDHMNSEWIKEDFNPNIISQFIKSICFYDSCVVLEKGRNLDKFAPQIGKKT
jgi:hypothetical protein